MTNEDLIAIGKELAAATRGFVDEIRKELDSKVASIQLQPGPVGAKGEKGETGDVGAKGDAGDKGETGEKGDTGDRGADGKDGRDGRDGADGKSVTLDDVSGAIETAIARSLLDFERRAMDVLQRAIENIPKPENGKDGAPGRDGVGFDDLVETIEDGGRVLVHQFLRDGVVVKEFRHTTAMPVPRGTWTSGREYLPGDVVAWGGGSFVALEPTTAQPGTKEKGSEAWALSAMRGREGKQGQPGLAANRTVKA